MWFSEYCYQNVNFYPISWENAVEAVVENVARIKWAGNVQFNTGVWMKVSFGTFRIKSDTSKDRSVNRCEAIIWSWLTDTGHLVHSVSKQILLLQHQTHSFSLLPNLPFNIVSCKWEKPPIIQSITCLGNQYMHFILFIIQAWYVWALTALYFAHHLKIIVLFPQNCAGSVQRSERKSGENIWRRY